MRLWSLHPCHLDARGLVALWREGLLARAVLLGKTRGYRHHPQLVRFAARQDPVGAIDAYLSRVLEESRQRGYAFDATKITYVRPGKPRGTVTRGQVAYEWRHLLAKLALRDPVRFRVQEKQRPMPHGSFRVVPGPVAAWEKTGRAV